MKLKQKTMWRMLKCLQQTNKRQIGKKVTKRKYRKSLNLNQKIVVAVRSLLK